MSGRHPDGGTYGSQTKRLSWHRGGGRLGSYHSAGAPGAGAVRRGQRGSPDLQSESRETVQDARPVSERPRGDADALWVSDQVSERVNKLDWQTGKVLADFIAEAHNTSGLAV